MPAHRITKRQTKRHTGLIPRHDPLMARARRMERDGVDSLSTLPSSSAALAEALRMSVQLPGGFVTSYERSTAESDVHAEQDQEMDAHESGIESEPLSAPTQASEPPVTAEMQPEMEVETDPHYDPDDDLDEELLGLAASDKSYDQGQEPISPKTVPISMYQPSNALPYAEVHDNGPEASRWDSAYDSDGYDLDAELLELARSEGSEDEDEPAVLVEFRAIRW